MSKTYLTTDELASRIKYDARTIRDRLKDSVLLEGIHYFRPFSGRKILYVWEQIEKDSARFEIAPEEDQGDDDGRRLVIDVDRVWRQKRGCKGRDQ